MKLIQKSFPAKRISPMDEHFFFGYYDLHPRCVPMEMISFDSTHEGFRGIYMVEMEPILEFFDKL